MLSKLGNTLLNALMKMEKNTTKYQKLSQTLDVLSSLWMFNYTTDDRERPI